MKKVYLSEEVYPKGYHKQKRLSKFVIHCEDDKIADTLANWLITNDWFCSVFKDDNKRYPYFVEVVLYKKTLVKDFKREFNSDYTKFSKLR